MPGGQRIDRVIIKSWKEIDFEKAKYFQLVYGLPHYPTVMTEGILTVGKIKPTQPLFEEWDDCGIFTYYTLPPVMERVIEESFKSGEENAKLKIRDQMRKMLGFCDDE